MHQVLALVFFFMLSATHQSNDVDFECFKPKYVFDPIGFMVRSSFSYAGNDLSLADCKIYCGCHGYTGGLMPLNETGCWCGLAYPNITSCLSQEQCNSNGRNCTEYYNTVNYFSDFETPPSTKLKISEPLAVSAKRKQYESNTASLLIDLKVTYHPFGSNVYISKPGRHSIQTEYNGSYLCPSEKYFVDVFEEPWAKIETPEQVALFPDSISFFVFVGGSNISKVIVTSSSGGQSVSETTFDPASDKSDVVELTEFFSTPLNITHDKGLKEFLNLTETLSINALIGGGLYMAFGANLVTDRFVTYTARVKTDMIHVCLDHKIEEDGLVTSFEAGINELGKMTFLILQPNCMNEKVDYEQMMCSVDGTDDPRMFKAPNSGAIFHSSVKRFLPTLSGRYESNLNFEVVFMFTVEADVLGNQVFPVPPEMQFDAKAGHVLALLTCSASVCGQPMEYLQENLNLFPTHSYTPPAERNTGMKFYKDSFSTSINYNAMIAVNIEVSARYKIEISLLSFVEGPFTTEVRMFSDGVEYVETKSGKAVVNVTGLNTSVQSDVALTGNEVTLMNTLQNGSFGANLSITWGDEYSEVPPIPQLFHNEVRHTYKYPGNFTIAVKAFNNFSEAFSEDVVVKIVCPPPQAKFFAIASVDVVQDWLFSVWQINLAYPVYVFLSGCGEVLITYEVNRTTSLDNTSVELHSVPMVLGNESIFFFYITPPDVYALMDIRIVISNYITSTILEHRFEFMEQLHLVEKSITYIMNEKDQVYEVNVLGTQETICVDFDNGTEVVYERNSLTDKGPLGVTLNYVDAGIYNLRVNATNKISQSYEVFRVVVEMLADYLIVAPAIQHGNESYAFMQIRNATDLKVCVTWTIDSIQRQNNCFFNYYTDFYRNLSVEFTQLSGFGVSRVRNLDQGTHVVCLSVSNNVMDFNLCTNHIVEYDLGNVKVSKNIVNDSFVDLQPDVYLRLVVTTSKWVPNANVTYDMGDGTIIQSKEYILLYTYTDIKQCFTIEVTITTHTQQRSTTTEACVFRKLSDISNMTILSDTPTLIGVQVNFNLLFFSGDYFNCTVDYHDDTYNDTIVYLNFTAPGNVTFQHPFQAEGIYIISVYCNSRLHESSTSTMVTIQSEVTSPHILVRSRCKNATEFVLSEGKGVDRNIYSSLCDLLVCMIEQGGTNATLNTSLLVVDNYKVDTQTGGNCTLHLFSNFPSIDDIYQLEIVVYNNVSQRTLTRDIRVADGVSLNVTQITREKEPDTLSNPVVFVVDIISVSSDTCLLIDLGDIALADDKFVYGGEDCEKDHYSYKYVPLVLKELMEIPFTVQYRKSGMKNINVRGINHLSWFEKILSVDVKDLPCFQPDVNLLAEFSEDPEDENVPKIKKCSLLVIKFSAQPICDRTDVHFVKGMRFTKADRNGTTIGEIHSFTGNSFKERNFFPYGIIKIVVHASMQHNETFKEIKDTRIEIVRYFEIVPCEIVLKFTEGNRMKLGRQADIVIVNASESHDPDFLDAAMEIKWLCMKPSMWNSTQDPVSTTYKAEADGKEDIPGCFPGAPEVAWLTDKGHNSLLLELNTVYMPNGCYIIRLILKAQIEGIVKTKSDDVHLCLSQSDPVIPVIRCVQNCKKINPNSKFSLSVHIKNVEKCTPSESSDDPITYLWTWKTKPIDNDMNNFEAVGENLLNKSLTGLTSKYFVLPVNMVHPGYLHLFQVNVDCDGLDAGVTDVIFNVNSPPDVSQASCVIAPSLEHGSIGVGISMIDEFTINCKSVVDDDLPLTFVYFYRCDKTLEFVELSAPVQLSTLSNVRLPSAVDYKNNVCEFEVQVKDNLGMLSERITKINTVKVSPPSFDENVARRQRRDASVEDMANSLDASICVLLNSLKIQNDQLRLANFMTVLRAMFSQLPSSIQTYCKKGLMSGITNVVVDSPDAAMLLLSNVGEGDTLSNEPMDPDEAEAKLEAISNMLGMLDSFSSGEFADFSTKVFAATSALTQNLSSDAAAHSVAKAKEMEAQIASNGASKMVLGEIPEDIITSQSRTTMQCIDSSKSVSLGGFQLGGGLVNDDDDADCSGAVNMIGSNPYAYDKKSAGNIKGDVIGLSLSGKGGKQKEVKNLSEPIILVLENKEKPPARKNFTAYCELMIDIHLFDVDVNESAIIIELEGLASDLNATYFLFMNKGTAPSLIHHDQNCTFPNPYPDNWDAMSEGDQNYWIREKKNRCFLSIENLNATAVGSWCVGVVYYPKGLTLTDHLQAIGTDPSKDNCTKPQKYEILMYSRACQYWDKSIRGWSGEGCTVLEAMTTLDKTFCACDHLTDFGGGGPFAVKQPLDLSKTLKNLNISDNPTVFSVVMVIFGLYLILLVWAWRRDSRDTVKGYVIPLADNHPSDNYYYEISIQTGFKSGCSSTADFVVVLTGSEGESAPRQLTCSLRKCFQRAEMDVFLMALPSSLGDLEELDIWHNNAGSSPGWYCIQINVRDLQTEMVDEFICNQWFDVSEDDGVIIRKLQPAAREQLQDFSFLFSLTTRRNLYDGHIWLSLFTRPAHSNFTRCQRLATCMSLLLTTMLANCMFYRGDMGWPSESIKLGPFTVSVDEVKVAFTSTLMVMPCNWLIILLFKYAGPKHQQTVGGKYEMSETETTEPNRESANDEVFNQHAFVLFLRSIFFLGAVDDRHTRLRKKRKPLPHWLVYAAYTVALVTTLVSGFFITMYSFAFGKVKAEQWLVSMFFSFVQSVFIIETFKVMVLSIIFAVLLKEPPPASNANTKRPLSSNEEDIVHIRKKLTVFKFPEARKLEESRQARFKEKRIKLIIKEVFVHLSFVVLCLITAYSNADPSSYRLYSSVQDICAMNGVTKAYFGNQVPGGKYMGADVPDAHSVRTRLEWFLWLRYSVIEYLFPDAWYNDINPYAKAFVADQASSKVLAMARIRQLRVEPMSCTKHPVFEYLVDQCLAGYSWLSEETKDYRAGWLPAFNITERFRRRRGKRKAMWKGLEDPWLYQNTTILKNPFPFTGKFATYNGASYSVSIGPQKNVANRIVKELLKNFWVDRYTRALFTEINIYNANTNLLLVVTFLHEILPTGGWNFYSDVQSIRLYRYVGGLGDLVILFDIIFITVTLVGLYRAVRTVRRNGLVAYLSNIWNLLHVIVTGCSLCAIVFALSQMLAVKQAVKQYEEEPELFVSFQFVGALEYLIIASLGFVIFFTNLEFLRILRFNYQISMLTKTVSSLGGPLSSFAMIFMVIFMAYVSFAHCIYVDKLEEFQTVLSSFVSLTKMFLGKFDVHEYFNNAPFFGPLMFASYMLSIQMVMINLFVGVICDAFADTGEEESNEEEPSVMEFMASRVRSIASGEAIEPVPIYVEWMDEWSSMMERFEERCDDCIFMMRNMESEDTRQLRFFKTVDSTKEDLLRAVLGVDVLQYEGEFFDGMHSLEKRLKIMTADQARQLAINAAALNRRENPAHDDRMTSHSMPALFSDEDDDFESENSEFEEDYRLSSANLSQESNLTAGDE